MSTTESAESVGDSGKSPIERVNVYIDGFNLYRSMVDASLARYLWLDLVAFAKNLLRPHQILTTINYYTAPLKGRRMREHQRDFLSANAISPHVKIRMGEFVYNKVACGSCGMDVACSDCGRKYAPPVEKQSDVNLGTQLGLDAASDLFDVAIIVSSDSDFVGAIKLVEEYRPLKRVIVCLPPRRHERGAALVKEGTMPIHVNLSMLRRAQLPRDVPIGDGQVARRPDAWS